MRARNWAIAIGGLDCVAAIAVAVALFLSKSDPATKGLDVAAGGIVVMLLFLTGAPALALAWTERAPRIALTLALGFPVAFVLVFIGAVIAIAV